ncbi:heavy metal translocating P-type ATPase [Catenovulum agarivorans DS-2]|uniref:Heavy metal translocating P-type ATPase n=1 Tax=Catenovulum agarivorans DS-2 TaxID=1328313 RepID=W7R3R7_9ALTE|nr:heavy metal translocating P-type ATPase [Catenovulum agarivorans]EWH12275.1 heavy metal translocating P-type ATPase [Catenovulum agarivorans DS-2]
MTSCYHCQEQVPEQCTLTVTVNGHEKAVCCAGCQAVANVILQGGFDNYYKFRQNAAEKPIDQSTLGDDNRYLAFDSASVQQEFVSINQNQQYSADISIQGMHCAACAWLIEKYLSKQAGVSSIRVNLTNARAEVVWDNTSIQLSEIFNAIHAIGYTPSPFKISQIETEYQQINKSYQKQLAVAGLFTMQVMMLAFALYFDVIEASFEYFFRWISLLLSAPVVFYSGLPLLTSAYRAISKKSINMDVPVVFAIYSTFIASAYATFTNSGEVYFESATMFVFLLLTSRYLEHLVKTKAAITSANLLKLLPLVAFKKTSAGIETVHANELAVGDTIQVKPGEQVPADGRLLSNTCTVEEAQLTGESLPISKQQGDLILAGSLVHNQIIVIEVETVYLNTRLAQIAKHQERVNQSKSPLANLADRMAKQATVSVLFLSIATFVGWQLLGENGLWYAVAVLVATCPCALSLALPTAISAASNALKIQGVLVRESHALEQADKLSAIAFDKTGTLTTGCFSRCKVYVRPDIKQNLLLKIVAAAEKASNHPLATGFSDINTNDIQLDSVTTLAHQGLQVKFQGEEYLIGSKSLFNRYSQQAEQTKWPNVQIYIFNQTGCIGAIEVEDQLKPTSIECMKTLDTKNVILSGDHSSLVDKAAKKLNIDFYKGLSPEEKQCKLQQLQDLYGSVAMVGDGVNDSIVLATADISIAMDDGAELSKYKADVILLNSQPIGVVKLIHMSQRLNRILKQNFIWAIGYNALALPLAVFGILTPWMAVIGMSASSLIVVSNSMRLLKK